jgi:hypothetical protein
MREADMAVEDAAARLRAQALRQRLEPALGSVPPVVRTALEAIIDEIGRVDAGAEAARQAAAAQQRSRGDWLQIDPLRHIPEDRGAPLPLPPSRFEAEADDADFTGFGWYPAERAGGESWRWSGLAPAASVVIPDLGLGAVAIELDVIMPFSTPFRAEAVSLLADGEPLSFEAVGVNGSRATLAATWEGREVTGVNLGLVILGPRLPDPRGTDSRQLGLGLRRVAAERI